MWKFWSMQALQRSLLIILLATATQSLAFQRLLPQASLLSSSPRRLDPLRKAVSLDQDLQAQGRQLVSTFFCGLYGRARARLRMSSMADTLVETEEAKKILVSFEPIQYEAPFWARNNHVNTIVGALFTTPPKADYVRERWNTPDGDFIHIDFLNSTAGFTRGMVLLYHGLESTTNAPLTVRQAFALAEEGFDVAAVCFRGCSGEDNLTPGAYHLGFTEDIRFIIECLHSRRPHLKIFLSGTSLGGNVMTKLLGELGADARALGVYGGAVACVPMNALQCQPTLDLNSFNRRVYSGNFLKSLKPKAERQHARFPELFNLSKVRAAATLGEFDDAFIAPVYGFKDKEDYYTQSGSGRLLHAVRAPLYILNALDDPFIDAATLPTTLDVAEGNVRLSYTKQGGHCGYLVGLRSLSVSWKALFSKVFKGQRIEAHGSAPNGYLATELARFVAHIDYSTGGPPPSRPAPPPPQHSVLSGPLGWFISVVACVWRYLGILWPKLAGGRTRDS